MDTDYEYLNYDGTEPKLNILKIYEAFHTGMQNPLIYIEALCYHLDLPVDDLTMAILGEHVYTPNCINDFTERNPNDHLLKFDQMTDYEGFLQLVEYADRRKKVLNCLREDLANQMKEKANEEN